jgi:hypothetical protein
MRAALTALLCAVLTQCAASASAWQVRSIACFAVIVMLT